MAGTGATVTGLGALIRGVAERSAPDTAAAAWGCDRATSGRRTAIKPEQTEHRARTPRSGTLAGSTRKMVEHWGQVTFMASSRAAGVLATRSTPDLVITATTIGNEYRARQ